MFAPDRRRFLTLLLAALALPAGPLRVLADKGGGGHNGNGGGNGNGNGHGNGHGDGDQQGHNEDDDDEDDRDAVRDAVQKGQAAPLRELLTIITRRYPGDVLDVRLRKSGSALMYRVKILDRVGRLLTVSIDAASRQILRTEGL
jgi:hypothetical protein